MNIAYGDKVEFAFNRHDEVITRAVKISLEDVYGVLKNHKPGSAYEDHCRLARGWAGEKGSKRG